jgi:hypothetical protein
MAYLDQELLNSINSAEISEDSYELIKDGWYQAVIEKSEIKKAKSNNGDYLSIWFSICDDGYSGRLVFSNLNIFHKNKVAEEIGRNELAKLRSCCEIENFVDTDQLIGCRVLIKVSSKDDKNIVKGFKRINKEEKDQNNSDSGFAPWS